MAEKLHRNWRTSIAGIIIIASSVAQHLLVGSPLSVEAVVAGLGLLTAGDAQ